MSKMKGGCGLIVFLLAIFASSFCFADEYNVYLYDDGVSSEVDINTYRSTGHVKSSHGEGFFQNKVSSPWISIGPAPEPYPQIEMAENTFEQLGKSKDAIDGVIFVNHGRALVPKKWALVLWQVRIPQAALRNAQEFHNDLSLALWVDWDEDGVWDKNEEMIRRNVNVYDLMPTTHDVIVVWYLTWFRVPDANEEGSMTLLKNKVGKGKKALHQVWARAVLAYDDANMSPDGQQMFGEYEDYLLTYRTTESDDDSDGHFGR
jgi:hypothetical protein